MFCFTGDPVMDAESYQMELEQQPHIYCEDCGERIYLETNTRKGDKHLRIDGKIRCRECAHDWLEEQLTLEFARGL